MGVFDGLSDDELRNLGGVGSTPGQLLPDPATVVMGNLRLTRDVQPPQMIEDIKLGDALGYRPETIAVDRDAFKQKKFEADLDGVLSTAPVTRSLFAQNKQATALFKDEAHILAGLEQAFARSSQQPSNNVREMTDAERVQMYRNVEQYGGISADRSTGRTVNDGAYGPSLVEQGVDKVLDMLPPEFRRFLNRTRDTWNQGMRETFVENPGSFLKGLFAATEDAMNRQMEFDSKNGYTPQAGTSMIRDTAKMLKERIAQGEAVYQAKTSAKMAPGDGNLWSPEGLWEGVVGMGPQLGSQLIAAAVGGVPLSMGWMGGQIAGGQFREIEEEGGVTPLRNFSAALVNAGLQAPLEQLGLNKAFGIFKASGFGRVAKAVGETMATEFFTEWAQNYPDSAAKIFAKAEREGWNAEQMVRQFGDDFFVTTVDGIYQGTVAALTAPLMGGPRIAMEARKARQAKMNGKFLEEIGKLGQQSQVAKELPEAWRDAVEFIRKQTGGTAPEELYVPAQTLETVISSLNQSADAGQTDPVQAQKHVDDTLSVLGISRDAFEQAKQLNADVAIPFALYQTHVAATDLGVRLNPDVRWAPDAMTMREADAYQGEIQKRIEEAMAQQQVDQVQTDNELRSSTEQYVAELQRVGMSKADAQASVSLLAKGAAQAAARWTAITGERMTPAQWLTEKRNLHVQTIEQGQNADGTLHQGSFIVHPSAAVGAALEGKASVAESTVDGLRGNAELLSNVFQSPAFLAKGFGGLDAPAQRVVLNAMLSFGHDEKVLRSVVKFIPANVVDMLQRFQLPAEDLFRNEAVLKNGLSAVLNDAVPGEVDKRTVLAGLVDALTRGVASVAAKGTLPLRGVAVSESGRSGEGLSTEGAGVGYLAMSVHDPLLLTFQNTVKGNNRGTFDASDPRILMQRQNLPSRQEILAELQQHPLVKLKEKPKRVFVVGSFASGKQIGRSDIDILLEISPKKNGESATDVENAYRRKLQDYFVKNNIREQRDDLHPNWNGRRVDVYFTYNADEETRPKVELGGPTTLNQSAFHGSPYRFDKFSLEHIGSGEGAQAFGYGLYFAGEKNVAEWYREALSGQKDAQSDIALDIDGQRFERTNEGWYDTENEGYLEYRAPEAIALEAYHRGEDLHAKLSDIKEFGEDWSGQQSAVEEALGFEGKIKKGEDGQLYEVTIPDDQHLMIWDKPLSEQPEAVKKALEPLFSIRESGKKETTWGAYWELNGPVGVSEGTVELKNGRYHAFALDGSWDAKFFKTEKGALDAVRRKMQEQFMSQKGETFYRNLKRGSARAASEYLRSLGIPGLRYLDGTSRSAGEGSYNYVIFDDARIAIDRTYYQGGFFSPTAKFVEAIQVKKPQPAKFWIDQLYKGKDPKPGLRPEELEDLGLREWLEGQQGVVSKEQVLQFIADGGPKLEEVRKGAGEHKIGPDPINTGYFAILSPEGKFIRGGYKTEEEARAGLPAVGGKDGYTSTKFGQYQLPGGENYREVLLTVPAVSHEAERIELTRKLREAAKSGDDAAFDSLSAQKAALVDTPPFTSSHWSEPNVIAHMRLNDRTDADGKRVLFIEEIQSDWHQAGRKEGYKTPGLSQQEIAAKQQDIFRRYDAGEITTEQRNSEIEALDTARGNVNAVPNAPFKKSWPMLAFKRILREAVEKGYDSVAWTTGEQQAERYDLSKQVDIIEVVKRGGKNAGTYDVNAVQDGRVVHSEEAITPERLADTIGKDLAEKAIADLKNPGEAQSYSGADLKVGGEGMKGFYDKMLPKAVQEYVRKLDPAAKVGETGIKTGSTGGEIFEIVLPNGKVVGQYESEKRALALAETFEGAVVRNTGGITPVHSIAITPAMRESITQNGQTLYAGMNSGPRGSITFTDRATFIKLFKGAANLSTFLHETAHLYVNDLEAMVATGKAPEQVVKDLGTLKSYAGDLTTVDAQEKLARSFEAYLREGKAPTPELRSAFQKFAAWLTAIYRDVRAQLGVELNDEIRGVFDRMLAAEDEISQAEAYYGRDVEMDAAAEGLLTPQEKKRIQELRGKSHADALEKRTQRYVKAYFKALGGKAAFEAQATREVEALPVYKNIAAIAEEGGLPVAEFDERFGKATRLEMALKFPGLLATVDSSILGLHDMDMIAVAHGYSKADEMAADFQMTKPKGEAVRELAAQKMQAEEAKLRASLEGEAVPGEEDIHNETTLSKLALEAQVLERKIAGDQQAKAALSQPVGVHIMREVAKGILETMSVTQARQYQRFSAAERRASLEAAKLIKAGKWAEALEAKQREAQNHALVIEAVKLRESVAKDIKFVRKLQDAKRMDFEAKEQALALIHSYKLGTDSAAPARPEELKPLAEFITSAYGDDDFGLNPLSFFSPWLLNKENVGSYKSLTVAEYQEVVGMLRVLSDIGGSEFARMASETERTRAEAITELNAATDASGYTAKKYDKGTTKERLSSGVRDVLASLQKIPDLLRNADGNVDATQKTAHKMGPHQELAERLHKGVSGMLGMLYSHQELKDIEAQKLDFAKRFKEKYGERVAELEGVTVPPQMQEAGYFTWTAERVWMIAHNMGNDGNLRDLIDGNGMTAQEIDRLVSVLTEADWKAVQTQGKLLGAYYDQTDKAFRKMYGFPMPKKVAPRPFDVVTADGKNLHLDGWYFPIVPDAEMAHNIGQKQEIDVLKRDPGNSFAASVKKSHTKARTGGVAPLNLSYEAAHRAMHDQARLIHLGPVVKDLNAIINDKEYRKAMVDAFGKQAYNELLPWLKNVAMPTIERKDSFDSALDKIRHLSTLYILGLNLKSSSKQYLGFAGAMNKLGFGWTVKGVVEMAKFKGMTVEAVDALSLFMRNRSEGLNPELAEINAKARGRAFRILGVKTGLTQKQVVDAVMVLTRLTDRHVTYSTWIGAYKKAQVELNMTQEEAVDFADRIVRRTQMSGSPVDITRWQREPGGKRFLTMFMSEAIPKSSRMRSDLNAFKNGNMTAAEYARSLFYESIAPAISYTMLMALVGAASPKDWWKDLFWQLYSETFGLFPLMGGLQSAVEYGQTKQTIPGLTGLELLFKVAQNSGKLGGGSEDRAKSYKTLVDGMAYIHGVGNLRRVYETAAEGWDDIDHNRTANPFRLFFKKPKDN